MTTRLNRPGPTARTCAISGGAGTTTVAVPLTVSPHLDVMSQPPYSLPRRVAAHRSHSGADRGGT